MFFDGNGCIGRVINLLFLIDKNLIILFIFYLSWYIIKNKNSYYFLLLKVIKDGDWELWILFILFVIENILKWMLEKINVICELMEYMLLYMKNEINDIYSYELL